MFGVQRLLFLSIFSDPLKKKLYLISPFITTVYDQMFYTEKVLTILLVIGKVS